VEIFIDSNGVNLAVGKRCNFIWNGILGTGMIASFGFAYPETNQFPICMVDFDDKSVMNGAQMSIGCVEMVGGDR